MSEAPERIWLTSFIKDEYGARLGRGTISDLDHGQNPDYPEYVRADRIEELEADNERLETEAKLQAEEIDKTRRRADKWQSMVLDCGEYLKPGETPAERIEREINDCLALMKLLEKKQMRIQELEAENKRLKALVADVIYSTGDDPEIMAASRAEWAARALAAEAKLAKALDFIEDLTECAWPYDETAKRILAELTGGKDAK